MTSTKTGIIALALALLVTPFAGCDDDEGQWVGPRKVGASGPKTAVIADSLVDQQDDLWQSSRLAQEGPIAISSIDKTTYASHREWIRALRPVPDRVIVALGTNNAYDYPPGDGWKANDETAFTELIGTIRGRGIDCIVLVTIAASPRARPSYKAHADRANAFLRRYADDDPVTFRLADWQAASSGTSSYFVDEIHHTALGARAHYRLLAETVRSC